MIGAYHWVRGGERTVQAIAAQGFLTPASERVDRREIAEACSLNLQMHYGDSPIGKALRALANEKLKDLRMGKVWADTGSRFECLDLIAGDMDLVFFAVGGWPYDLVSSESAWHRLSQAGRNALLMNGFVFDAERLVTELDARMRSGDLLDVYGEVVGNVKRTTKLVRYAKSLIAEELARVQAHMEKWGGQAIAAMRRCESECELVVSGRVLIDLAEEVWVEGERVR